MKFLQMRSTFALTLPGGSVLLVCASNALLGAKSTTLLTFDILLKEGRHCSGPAMLGCWIGWDSNHTSSVCKIVPSQQINRWLQYASHLSVSALAVCGSLIEGGFEEAF